MLSLADFLHLPYTADLTEAGIAYALRSPPAAFDRAGSSPYDAFRRTVASAAVELAFRRYLSRENIPFEVHAAMPFTEPHRYDVSLGGHRCDIRSFLISRRAKISAMHRSPQMMLNAPAVVPFVEHSGGGSSEHDLFLFAFVSGLVAASQATLKKVAETGQPYYLVHLMGAEWRKPAIWRPLGPLALKSESEEELLIEISGQDQGREYLTRTLRMPPKSEVVADDPFYTLGTVHATGFPTAHLGIRSPACEATHVVRPRDWGNIWVYGMDIYLAGYISRQEFRQRAVSIAPNSRVFHDDRTHGKNLAVQVSDLSPLSSLFDNVRAWDRNKTQ